MSESAPSTAEPSADPSADSSGKPSAQSSAPAAAASVPASVTAPAPATSKAASAPSGSYAIVEASGQQFWLQPNRYLDLDRLAAEVDSTVTLENVLLVKDGSGTTLGQPYVKGATVELKVMAHRRGTKILVYKMRPKKKTRRKNGHRQELTRVMVEAIRVGGKAIS
jgi:large subunit ribosomal protein L21